MAVLKLFYFYQPVFLSDKMNSVSLTLLLFFTLTASMVHSQSDKEWKLLREEAGIRVYTRNRADSPLKGVKVVTDVRARLSSLVALMKDSPNHHNWVYSSEEACIIKKFSYNHWMFYGRTDAPWPVFDRDMVVEATLCQDEKTKVVRLKSECRHDFLPENSGVVRVKNCHTLWLLEPLDDGRVHVTLEISADLAGGIPAWLLNLVIAKGPYRTVKNMTQEVGKPPYCDAVIDCIKD